MFKAYTKTRTEAVVKIQPILLPHFEEWTNQSSELLQNWIKSYSFKPDANKFLLIANDKGQLEKILLVVKQYSDLWAYSSLAKQLPSGVYEIDNLEMTADDLNQAALGWGLGSYRFLRYKTCENGNPQLLISDRYEINFFEPMVNAFYLVRDMINTPAEDLTPHDIAHITADIAHSYNAKVVTTVGKDLLTKNYPAIYTVGRASPNQPHLIDMTWGNPRHPKLTLIGKGVCFDSGGLDLKSSQNMALMKKDMAGAAHVLALAKLIMTAKLKVRLRVMIPAVENAIDANSYRPGDIIKMRKGLTVEVGNTDAEGRLILADALTEACEEKPDLVIDIASLTGAARVALGPEVPIFFTNADNIAALLTQSSLQVDETICRLPLYQPYRQYIESRIADLNNNSCLPYAGAITAALFLQSFIDANIDWIHFDIMGWNLSDLPGRSTGGEAMGIRAVFKFLQDKYQ